MSHRKITELLFTLSPLPPRRCVWCKAVGTTLYYMAQCLPRYVPFSPRKESAAPAALVESEMGGWPIGRTPSAVARAASELKGEGAWKGEANGVTSLKS